jgi:phage-related protein (TIGR01555 family)
MPADLPHRRIRAGAESIHDRLNGLLGSGDVGQAFDYFSNVPARMGFGTPSLAEAATYELERLSFSYWLLITLYENHWIAAKIVDTPAKDMIKAWPRLTSDVAPKDLTRIDHCLRATQTKTKMLQAMKWGRLFGGAGALIVIDGQEDQLDEPVDLDTIGVGDYKGLIPFDRWTGIYPEGEICSDVNRPIDFGRPEMYRVNLQGGKSFNVHCSRILRFTGPEMPSPEREAHSWWGISEIVRPYEEIRKRDNMSWNILSLTFRAQILGMKYPELEKMLAGVGIGQAGAQQWNARMSEITRMLSNQSLIALPKDGEIQSVNYTFSGLSDCYQQFQLDISGATGIPVTRLFGRTISGLGQSNDADERIYEERIASDQDEGMRPQLEKLYPVICMSTLGEVPDDLDLTFPSVRVLDEKEKSELGKTVADTVLVAMNGGIISARTAGKELKQASDKTEIFTNITDEDIEKLSDEISPEGEMGGDLFGAGGGGGLNPAGSPSKVLKQENREGKEAGEKPEPGQEPDSDEDGDEDSDDEDADRIHGLRRMARAADDAEWQESKIKRDDEGKFAGGTGGTKSGGAGSRYETGKTDHLVAYKSREQWPEHAKKLAIPPAWTDVRVSPNPKADLQATGRDSKGRPQYIYSQRFKDSQAAMKFERVESLAQDISMIDKQLSTMRKSRDEHTRDHADCMALIRKMGLRPGSESDTKAKVKAYGASTLMGHHVWELGNATRLRFVGKKGVTISLPVEDADMARMLRSRKRAAGAKGKIFPSVSDASLRTFSNEKLDHGSYHTKDFRTHIAAETAQGLVESIRPPRNEAEYKKKVKEVAKKVAERLGNTATVALQSYIPPQIFSGWRASLAV